MTEPSAPAALTAAFERLRLAWSRDGGLDAKARKAHLKALQKAIGTRRERVCDALAADFGNRSRHETMGAELWLVMEAIRHARTHLDEWMEPVEKDVGWQMQPATARVVFQPLGVVGLIAPWNYPFQLSFAPLVAAIAAGNRVLLKPSEYTPQTNKVVAEILSEVFPADVVSVVEGGAEVGAAFAELPFDHIFFTGSTKVGRLVAMAAAKNLVPVTLELGGKSPAIVHDSASLDTAARRIAFGKTYNAGQTCIAPDYALVPRAKVGAFVEAFTKAVSKMYPTLKDNADYTCIIHAGQVSRLLHLVDDAEAKGAKVTRVNPANEALDPQLRKLAPTVLTEVKDDMLVLQDEIFGPILPVIPYDTLDDAIRYVNERPRPLALYYFDHSGKRQDEVLARTMSGGVTLNDVLVHNTQEELPFGGVGPAGQGRYHGRYGFEAFSHHRAVFDQARLNGMDTFNPPYTGLATAAMKFFIGR